MNQEVSQEFHCRLKVVGQQDNKENIMVTSYFGMPFDKFNKSYPAGPYRFINREYLIITYKTAYDKLAQFLPDPLKPISDEIYFEFIRMPDSSGFGNYTEAGQVIPVEYEGTQANFTVSMYLDDFAPIAAGREIWGFPKKYAKPVLEVDCDTLLGTLDYGKTRIATATMEYKFKELDKMAIQKSLQKPNFLLKAIPDADGSPKICQLVRYYLENVDVLGAWEGAATLELHPHVQAPVNYFQVNEVVSAVHYIANLSLPYGEVVKDYLSSQ